MKPSTVPMTVAKPENAAFVRMNETTSAESAVKPAQHRTVIPAMRTIVSAPSQVPSTMPR